MDQLRICFVGKMRSGKSEAVEYIKNNYDTDVVDFGDNLKEIVDILYPTIDKNIKRRSLYTKVGQHMRKLDEDIWIKSVRTKICGSKKEVLCVASCRQKNEYDFLKSLGFTFIKVVCRKDSIRIKRAEDSGDVFKLEDFIHETEISIDDIRCDYSVYNEATKEELYAQLENVINTIKENKHEYRKYITKGI